MGVGGGSAADAWSGMLFHKRTTDRKQLFLWISVLEWGTRGAGLIATGVFFGVKQATYKTVQCGNKQATYKTVQCGNLV